MEGLVHDEFFPGLTWLWGPALYRRNRAVFRSMIVNHFSDWERTRRSWKRVRWSDHEAELQAWLDATRANRDTPLVRRLLRWKHAARTWGVDSKTWNRALLADCQRAPTAAGRAIVTDEYDDWFELVEDTAVLLYRCDRTSSRFIRKHLPRSFWGSDKRPLWQQLAQVALDASDVEVSDINSGRYLSSGLMPNLLRSG